MKLQDVFKRKPKVVVRPHSDACGCRKCLGLDVVHNEMKALREDMRYGQAKAEWIRDREKVRTTVKDVTNDRIIKLIGKKKFDEIKGNDVNGKTEKVARKYFRGFG